MTNPAVPEKWINGFDASQPLADAARRALGQRLEAVEKLLRPVCRRSMSPDQVHQLRVATRRASASLRAFEACLKNNTRRRMDRRLKKIRSAAARVRVADVHLKLLGHQLEVASSEDRAALEHLISLVTLERAERARDLARPARKLTKDKLRRRMNKLLESIKDQGDAQRGSFDSTGDRIGTFQRAADLSLAVMATELRESLAADVDDPVALHAVRLHGKRLRYALEIFAVCVDATARDQLYGDLASLQERLGAINDQYELTERASLAADQLREALLSADHFTSSEGLLPELQRLQDSYRLAAEQAHQEFLTWWRSESSNGVRERIERLSSGPQSSLEPHRTEKAAVSDERLPEVVIVRETIEPVAEAAETDGSGR